MTRSLIEATDALLSLWDGFDTTGPVPLDDVIAKLRKEALYARGEIRGFRVISTGGGCEAFSIDIQNTHGTQYIMVTSDDGTISGSATEPYWHASRWDVITGDCLDPVVTEKGVPLEEALSLALYYATRK